MRRARGVAIQDIARECGLSEAEVLRWLQEDEIEELVESCRAMLHLSEDERLAMLERDTLDMLQIAVEERDVKVLLFLADQFSKDKKPHKVLARAINRKVTQANTALDEPLSSPNSAPADPEAARHAARSYRVMHPWAHDLSHARRSLMDDTVRAFLSRHETPRAENKPSAPALGIADAGIGQPPSAVLPDRHGFFRKLRQHPGPPFAQSVPSTEFASIHPGTADRSKRRPRDGP
ncbi:MAG: hypothetical protein AAFY56_02735 [Pseudomonadota bacterium]